MPAHCHINAAVVQGGCGAFPADPHLDAVELALHAAFLIELGVGNRAVKGPAVVLILDQGEFLALKNNASG